MVTQTTPDVRGSFYIVATPIGNLDDITARALKILESSDYIAAEDTRHSKKLLNHFGIETKLFSVHDHNERDKVDYIKSLLDDGKNVALVSDAGTPLISDPGYHVVNGLREANYPVVPVPGPSALITALCASGLPTDQFSFLGFLPAKSKARKDIVANWANVAGTVVFYESTHRIIDSVKDINEVHGDQVTLSLARELTKTFETFLHGTPSQILDVFALDSNQTRGEFVVMASLKKEDVNEEEAKANEMLDLLLPEVSVKKASEIVAKFLDLKKNQVYKLALEKSKND
ncbi:16S rRNA (cytidine(1402)-2'-O)-methyltransferase [Marinomonas balearica]|uniref:Ribosomal RNA small subunit methyltransferase I n=1 Tax=Marinomonas balearica TaxID=491947 RepID=A0A4V3CGA4_9GAMM|nr:16S rRNA (cytidine(1402)-2'-O)-methyltransferase [Marinomonas balearica]TDO96962.1 16S rRNA (cytidine1402-2'-O)-methyltransferase [Marinomonas balearica]